MVKKALSWLGYLILCVCLGLVIRHFSISTSAKPEANSSATQTLFASSLPDAHQHPQALKQWQGKTIVLNFWATWCPPCREEMPELSQFYRQHQQNNVIVLGIAVDSADAVNAYLKENSVSYPLLLAEDTGMDLAAKFGNNKDILPYTVIIQPNGHISATFFGRITLSQLETSLKSPH